MHPLATSVNRAHCSWFTFHSEYNGIHLNKIPVRILLLTNVWCGHFIKKCSCQFLSGSFCFLITHFRWFFVDVFFGSQGHRWKLRCLVPCLVCRWNSGGQCLAYPCQDCHPLEVRKFSCIDHRIDLWSSIAKSTKSVQWFVGFASIFERSWFFCKHLPWFWWVSPLFFCFRRIKVFSQNAVDCIQDALGNRVGKPSSRCPEWQIFDRPKGL